MNNALAILRDRKTSTAEFRRAAHKLGDSLTHEMKILFEKQGVTTEQIVLVLILRSGVALLDAATRAFPNASVGVLGMKRDEQTFEPHWYYENLPPLSGENTIILLDPMLATGGSAEAAVARLVERGAASKHIYFAGIIAAPEGLARLREHIPHGNIVLAAVDRGLDARKYIEPGLGDFGDRYFGY